MAEPDEVLLPEDVAPIGADEREVEQALGAEYHKRSLNYAPPPPQGARWWCAKHHRCLTYAESNGQLLPLCNWCRDPQLLARPQRSEDDDVGQGARFGTPVPRKGRKP